MVAVDLGWVGGCERLDKNYCTRAVSDGWAGLHLENLPRGDDNRFSKNLGETMHLATLIHSNSWG